jgi:hypothetical protein
LQEEIKATEFSKKTVVEQLHSEIANLKREMELQISQLNREDGALIEK